MKSRIDIYSSALPGRAVLVWNYLTFRANKEGACFPSIKTMARDTKLSRSTVKRALRDLEKAGFLVIEAKVRKNGGKSSNMYRLL